jgi:hypothetical protein
MLFSRRNGRMHFSTPSSAAARKARTTALFAGGPICAKLTLELHQPGKMSCVQSDRLALVFQRHPVSNVAGVVKGRHMPLCRSVPIALGKSQSA